MRKRDLPLGRMIDLAPIDPSRRGALVTAILIYPLPEEWALSLRTNLRLSGRRIVEMGDVEDGWVAVHRQRP